MNGTAAAALCAFGVLFEGATPWGGGKHGVFGYVNKGRYAATSVYLALVPGIVGHTSFNAVLKHISPMAVTLALTTEPLIGSLVGWGAGVTAAPGVWTYLGGLVLIAATMVVVRAEEMRKQAAAAAPAAAPAADAQHGTEMQALAAHGEDLPLAGV